LLHLLTVSPELLRHTHNCVGLLNKEIEALRTNNQLTIEEKEEIEKELNQKIEEVKKTRFELIGTPKELAVFHNKEWFLIDNHITTVLFTADLLEGSSEAERLIEKYNREKDEILDKKIELSDKKETGRETKSLSEEELPILRKERAFLLLQESIAIFEPTGGRAQEKGRTFSPKYDFYRMANLLIDGLAYLYNIKENNVWDRLEKLFIGTKKYPAPLPIQTSETPNKEGISNLIWMLDRTLQIRLKNYMSKETQNEDMVLLDEYNARDREELIKKGLGISMKDMFEVYYVMLEFHHKIEDFTEQKGRNSKIFLNELYCDDSNFVQGYIYNLLLNYDKVIECYKKDLEIIKSELGENDPHVAQTLNNLGTAYHSKGKYDQALQAQ